MSNPEPAFPGQLPNDEGAPPRSAGPDSGKCGTTPPRRAWTRSRILFFVVVWLIVLMPFLFWRATWFGRPLSDQQISQYLRDDQKPRNVQHALVQIGERLSRREDVSRWYPELVRLSTYPVEEVRNTDAWVMGQDTTRPEFHQALLRMLNDQAAIVRSNAALALVRFADDSGHQQIVEMFQPARIVAPQAGQVSDTAQSGQAIRQYGMIAKLAVGQQEVEVRSPLAGRVRSVRVQPGDHVAAGAELAVVDPGEDQVWEALRALYVIGRPEDLQLVAGYERSLPDLGDRIRQQAALTERAIRERAK